MLDPTTDHSLPSILRIGLSDAAVFGGLTAFFGFAAASLTSNMSVEGAIDIAEASAGMTALGFVLGIGSGIGIHSFEAAVRLIRYCRHDRNNDSGPQP